MSEIRLFGTKNSVMFWFYKARVLVLHYSNHPQCQLMFTANRPSPNSYSTSAANKLHFSNKICKIFYNSGFPD